MTKQSVRVLQVTAFGIGVLLIYKAYTRHKKLKETEISAEELMAEIEVRKMLADRKKLEEDVEDDVETVDDEESDEYFRNEHDPETASDVLVHPWDRPDVDIFKIAPTGSRLAKLLTEMADKPINMEEQLDDEDYEYIDEDTLMVESLEEEKVEEEVLRHDPNSELALTQYFNMRLAGFDSPEIIQLMTKLFGMHFAPVNENDLDLYEKIQEQRTDFFGQESRWNNYASFGEVILMFAEMADYQIDGGVESYVDDWLDHVGITMRTGEATLDKIVDDLCNHIYMGKQGFGLFALDQEAYDDQLLKYPGARIKTEKDISFLMEYEVWLNGMLEILSEEESYEED